jgi:hypothetical protein
MKLRSGRPAHGVALSVPEEKTVNEDTLRFFREKGPNYEGLH